MKRFYALILIIFFFSGCGSVHYASLQTPQDQARINKLTNILYRLSHNQKESKELAKVAIMHSKVLANRYNLVSPPLYHNFLVNSGQRQKGLCYDFVDDLMAEIRTHHFRDFRFRWGRANANRLDEHNVIVVLGKDTPFNEGVILDAWRNSGILYFTKVKDDPKYHFKPWPEGDIRINY